MGSHTSLTPLVELLYKALKAPTGHVCDHPEPRACVEAIYQELQTLLEDHSPLIITSSKGSLRHQDTLIRNAPIATQAIAKEMEIRGIGGVAFYAGIDYEELELCLFALQLPVNRLRAMGGVRSLAPEGSNICFLAAAPSRPVPLDRIPQRWLSISEQARAT